MRGFFVSYREIPLSVGGFSWWNLVLTRWCGLPKEALIPPRPSETVHQYSPITFQSRRSKRKWLIPNSLLPNGYEQFPPKNCRKAFLLWHELNRQFFLRLKWFVSCSWTRNIKLKKLGYFDAKMFLTRSFSFVKNHLTSWIFLCRLQRSCTVFSFGLRLLCWLSLIKMR